MTCRRCGHERAIHQHFASGLRWRGSGIVTTWCAEHGCECPQYRRWSWRRRRP